MGTCSPDRQHSPVVQRLRRLSYKQETMVRFHPGLLFAKRLDTPIGRAVRLKPGCLQVRVLLWVLKKRRLGRQSADHLGLEPGMLWVRVPPEPLTVTYVLVEQPGVLACLSRRRSWVQIPSGTLDNTARYANWQSGQAQNLVFVGSNPSRATVLKLGCVPHSGL